MQRVGRRIFVGMSASAAAFALLGAGKLMAEQPPVRLVVRPGVRLGRLQANSLGFSTEKNTLVNGNFYVPANRDFTGICKLLGPQVLRVGGTHVDHTAWAPSGGAVGQAAVSRADLDIFAGYLRSLGWKVIYGLNLATATAAEAADEGRYAAEVLGDTLLAFELGNEPDLYVVHGDRPAGYGYTDFLREWRQHADALRDAVPHAPLCGPGAFHAWQEYALPFAMDEGRQISLLTQHYYRMSGKRPGATLDSLLDGMPALFHEIEALVAAAARSGVPGGFRLVEANTFVGGGLPGVSDRAVSALWAIELTLRGSQSGMAGVNFQIGPAAHSNSSVTIGPGPHISEIRPECYGMLLVAGLTAGQMLGVQGVLPSGLSAFAIDTADNQRHVVLNNMTNTPAPSVTVDFASGTARATSLLLESQSLLSSRCTLGGITLGIDGRGTPSTKQIQGRAGVFQVSVPAASALHLSTHV